MCSKKWHGNDKKMGQKCQNLGHLQTPISQATNKILTNFQRLEATTIHGHMRCVKKVTWDWQKMGQKYQNLGHLQTTISQARNKLLKNFQRLESTTIHGHMRCVEKSDIGMTKKWGKSAKIRSNLKLQYLMSETSFQSRKRLYNHKCPSVHSSVRPFVRNKNQKTT